MAENIKKSGRADEPVGVADRLRNLLSQRNVPKDAYGPHLRVLRKAASKLRAHQVVRREPVHPLERAVYFADRLRRALLQPAERPRRDNLRQVRLGEANDEYARNFVKSSKYNFITFLPGFLFEMFSRVPYLYFLIQACLSWWSVVSPFSGVGSTTALSFVAAIAGIKAAAEDWKRHLEDGKTNSSTTHVITATGEVRDIAWRDVRVGELVMVRDGELVPADLLFLAGGLAEPVAFLRTTNLDGETNLKARHPVIREGLRPGDPSLRLLAGLQGVLECDLPGPHLHRFNGQLVISNPLQPLPPDSDTELYGSRVAPSASTSRPGSRSGSPGAGPKPDALGSHVGRIVRQLYNTPPPGTPAASRPGSRSGSPRAAARQARKSSPGQLDGSSPTATTASHSSSTTPMPGEVPRQHRSTGSLGRLPALADTMHPLPGAGSSCQAASGLASCSRSAGEEAAGWHAGSAPGTPAVSRPSSAGSGTQAAGRTTPGGRRRDVGTAPGGSSRDGGTAEPVALGGSKAACRHEGDITPAPGGAPGADDVSRSAQQGVVAHFPDEDSSEEGGGMAQESCQEAGEKGEEQGHPGRGQARAAGTGRIQVTMDNMLLRGCMLKNSRFAVGVVVYAGADTRIQRNASPPPNKIGSFDRFLNYQILIVIVLQLVMCAVSAVANYWWRENYGRRRYHLAFDECVSGNWRAPGEYIPLVFVTFWILYSYLVPISLFVSLEVVKFVQAFLFINNDPEMGGGSATGEPSYARNSSLNEDLGKVEMVFADKTGTLTCNDMRLRMVAVKGVVYGSPDYRLEEEKPESGCEGAMMNFDPSMHQAITALKASGCWEAAVAAGGSPSALLPLDRHSLQQVGGVLGVLGCADKDGVGEVRVGKAGGPPGEPPHLEVLLSGLHMVDFWTAVTVCHSAIIEREPGSTEPVYQGPSPDEVALLTAGRTLGFEFVRRGREEVEVELQGCRALHQVLNVLEFSSERRRMSVITRAPDGSVHLYCKGADSAVLPLVGGKCGAELLRDTHGNLHTFASQGLRTLIVASKALDPEEYEEWDERYQREAAAANERANNRRGAGGASDRGHGPQGSSRLAELVAEMESDLVLIGVTAIEDKLQEGVPEAISTLLCAGVRVWMITGDKRETATNIAVSCHLLRSEEDALVCTAGAAEDIDEQLKQLQAELDARCAAPAGRKDGRTKSRCIPNKPKHRATMPSSDAPGLVLDGRTLDHILVTGREHALAALAAGCSAVVVCRASPRQKSRVVTMMRKYLHGVGQQEEEEEQAGGAGSSSSSGWGLVHWLRRQRRQARGKLLAIGDGANDVAMIQVADVGVGVLGREGRQAVNAADHALGAFRHLARLLLVHGHLGHYRLANLIKYSFFKNVSFGSILFYYQFFCGFSGQALVDDISGACYNVLFTSMPILVFALLDRPISPATLMAFPQVYNRSASLTTWAFWKVGYLLAFADGAVCFFIPYLAAGAAGRYPTNGMWTVGLTAYAALLGSVTLEAALIARYWTWAFGVVTALSFLLVFPYLTVLPIVEAKAGAATFAPPVPLFATGYFWTCLFTVCLMTFGARFIDRSFKWMFYPDDTMILADAEAQGRIAQVQAVSRSKMEEA